MKSILSVITIFFVTLGTVPLKAQNAGVLASQYITKYKNHVSDASLLGKLDQLSASQVIDAYMPYASDTLSMIRSVAIQQISRAGLRENSPLVRQKAVTLIIGSLNDPDIGNIGANAGLLTEFMPADFSAEHRYLISEKIKKGAAYADKLILLSGYLNITELLYNYRLMMGEPDKYSTRTRMNMQFAMARMGDTTAIVKVMARVGKITVTDEIVYEIYPLLAYTRQKAAFDYLLETIMSDSKDCLSSNPDKEIPIICAFRVIEMVAPYIEQFPAQTDAGGELISTNYNNTLTAVRTWINTHQKDYTLNHGKY